MSIFCSIIQTYINKDNFFYIHHDNKINFWKYVYEKQLEKYVNNPNLFLYMYISDLYYGTRNFLFAKSGITHEKFRLLNKFLNNQYISTIVKEKFLQIFQKSQRLYNGLNKLVYLYKLRRAKIMLSMDLYMNDITDEQKNVITVFQNGSKYLFIYTDLIKIINTALLNSSYFFSVPKRPKNPYSNLIFDNVALYNIYFFIKEKNITIPTLFHLFFKSNFDIDHFLYNNETIIRETFIKNYVNNSPATILYNDVQKMLDINYKHTKKIIIHEEIPEETIVNIFKPYLHLYYLQKFGVIGTIKKVDSLAELEYKLKRFVKFNYLFGRKIYKEETKIIQVDCKATGQIKYKTKKVLMPYFNLRHVNFYDE